MENIFNDKNICIFGGTGTVGSLIVEYLLTQKPNIIRVFSNSEQELWEAHQRWGYKKVRYLLGDIRDKERVKRALKGIDYVFNCAAVKHVPFAEYNPMEAVNVNIHGLVNIIEECIIQGVKKLLHMSTDKAVEPTCVMGNTKAIGERLLQIRWSQNPEINMVCVRSGNIYGSRGSIISLVRKLKKQNKPITVTNENMERYFIKPNRLTKFIIKAFREGNNGEIWVPKLKNEKLMDIIKGEVGSDYPIEIIGLRKGEKITERLLSDTELSFIDNHRDYWIIKNDWRNI